MYISFKNCALKLLPLQGANAPTRDTQGVASLALGYVLHWAFSPSLLNPKLELFIVPPFGLCLICRGPWWGVQRVGR